MQPDGQLLGGRYELLELIAGGGMGQVWRALDTRLNRDVAVKVLRREFTSDPTFLARFRAESQHSAGLLHPHIATLLDYGEVRADRTADGEQLAYLVMELVRGESLSQLLRREHRLGADRTLEVLRQGAAGLGAAHAAGVVHRDVKPGNVLLGADGTVKLTDFGVAVSAASVPLTRTGEVVGTANYLSPEQAQGLRATPASDVYALGLVGYECLAGRRGFDGESSVQVALRQIREVPPPLPDDVPEPVRRLIDRAIAKDPQLRFADGAAFRAAIDDVLAGRPIGSAAAEPRTAVLPAVRVPDAATRRTPPPPFPPTRVFAVPVDADPVDADLPALADQPVHRRRWPLLVAVLLVLLVVGGGTFGLLTAAGRRPDAPAVAATTAPPVPPAPSTPVVVPVSLSTADYVGRPFTEAQAELVALGLAVTPRPLQTGDVADGSVITLDPVGEVQPGAVVTLTYATAPPPTPTPPAPTPTPAPAPAQTVAPEPTPAPEPAPTEFFDEDDVEDWQEWVEDNYGDWRDWQDDRPGRGNGGN